ncbi:MAG TPA: endonuclease/exonuclease/phosphatase family protein [Solirubrobacteraceae bacterium]|nr:endonuclease/exonuclease/phosphatase family protein [Solirubrobacteraceae bacterium]
MLVVSWNLAGRVKRLGEQAERLAELDADVICLQELTGSTLPRWRQLLADAGYAVEHPDAPSSSERARPLFVLSACRQPARQVPVADVPWPERVLALELGDGCEVVNVHSPISPKPELAKVRTHRAVYGHLAHAESRPRILCGDLNTPRREHPDGTVWTFARDRYGRLRPDRGEEWDEAELLLLRDLGPHGFRDAFRTLHGYERREISWGWQRWKGGYRLDHLLVSGLTTTECRYEHRWREEGLSDHSALVARLTDLN